MRFREVAPGLYRASRKVINIYAIVKGGETTLFDTGEPSFAPAILRALAPLPPLRHILLTHVHYDHVGSAARIAAQTNAAVYAHPAEAALLASGRWRRPCTASPTLLGRVMKRLIADGFPDRVDPVIADPVNDVKLDIAGGLRIIALPGHSAGQIGFGVPLGDGRTAWIVGDVIMNVLGPREPILYENRAEGLASIGRLAQTVNNSDFICPGHGSPIPVSPAVQSTLGTLSHEG
jgi:glyoxylase-like metal-dependent hydrolase (beta-lactamase superfamily II)